MAADETICYQIFAEVCMSKDVTVARRWIEGISQGIIATVIFALISGGAVTYLSLINSIWTVPILRGLGTIALFCISIFAIKGIRLLPAKRTIPNLKNIETCVRLWLDNFRVGVKNDPIPTTYFRVVAT